MDIVYCINEKYVPYVEVSMCSLLENNIGHDIIVHILTDNIDDANKNKLINLGIRYNQEVKFHEVKDSSLRNLKDTWSIYVWYRILIPNILTNVDKCLYLDADTIIVGDISDLFTIDITNKSIGAVLDIETLNETRFKTLGYEKSSKYICSGIMMMNLDYWRDNSLSDKIKNYAIEKKDIIEFPDQDCINYVCKDTKILLPLKYGIINPFILNEIFLNEYRDEIIELLEDPRIIHYAGLNPWIIEKNRHFMRDYFFRYNKMLGCPVKSRHLFTGMTLLKYRVKRLLDFLNIIEFKPYFCIPVKNKNKILESLYK